MSKERLEDVIETMAHIKMYESKETHNQEQADMAKCYLIERHGDWLIKQAERAQELEKYCISEKRLKELLNGNEDIGELYQFVEDNQKIEDVISMLIKEMGYLAGALDDYNKGFFELEKQNKRYREALEEILNADWNSEGLDAERELDKVTDVAFKALEGEE